MTHIDVALSVPVDGRRHYIKKLLIAMRSAKVKPEVPKTCMIATEERLASIDLPEGSGLTIRFLDQIELQEHVKDPANDLSEDFLHTAFGLASPNHLLTGITR